jgi:hypothetical protein
MKGKRALIKIVTVLIFLGSVWMCFSYTRIVCAQSQSIQPPSKGAEPDYAVPVDVVEKVAMKKAHSLWGEVSVGPVIPYVDLDGRTVAYMFDFRLDGKEFPSYEEVARECLLEEEQNKCPGPGKRTKEGENEDLSQKLEYDSFCQSYAYAHLLVSARYDRTPILNYGGGASEYYRTGLRARQKAIEIIGDGTVKLIKIYFLFPGNIWYEFSDGRRNTVVDAHLTNKWQESEDFIQLQNQKKRETLEKIAEESRIEGKSLDELEAHMRSVMEAKWEELVKGDISKTACTYVPGRAWVPYYDWSYGCSPTSAAMVLGWIDGYSWYGRLVDFFVERWDMVEGETDYQIPNVQRELALAMGTDTTTGGTSPGNIGSGLISVTNTTNGYCFTLFECDGSILNDWCWGSIQSEINNGHAFVWSASWEAHSLCAYGYCDDKTVVVHTTWGCYEDYWAHTDGGLFSFSWVDSPHRACPEYHDVDILSPRGDTLCNHNGSGEQWTAGETRTIQWTNYGYPGSYVNIYYSTSGGAGSWTTIVSNTPDDGSHSWTIPCDVSGNSCRIRISQYTTSYVSGDGSFGNFKILSGQPSCQVSPTSLDFGTVCVGEYSEGNFSITNTGCGVLSGNVSESCPDFIIVTSTSYSLGSGQSKTFTIRFQPASTGLKTCTIETGNSICSDVSCSGTGVVAVCQVNPTSLDFGTVCVGEYSDRTFTITNTGGCILSGTISESCPDYSIVSGGGSYSLGAGQSRTVTVRFQPASTGLKTCTIETGNSICSDVSCSGTGDPCTECEISPSILSFDTVCVGQHKDKTFTITNTGGGTLSGTVSESCGDFSIVGSTTYTLGAGESDTFTVRFEPQSSGPKNCTVETGNDSCADVSCTGTGKTAPSTPANVTAQCIDEYIHVCWDDVVGESGYYVYRNSLLHDFVGANTLCYDDNNPGLGLQCYQISAYNVCGESPQSTPACDSCQGPLEPDSIYLAYGWNMVSLPSLPPYNPVPKDSIFDQMFIYGYNCGTGNYNMPQYLYEGKGYWVARTTPSDTVITYLGTCVSCYTETLCLGWNMIGATCEPVLLSSVMQNPPGCIIPYTLYWWNPFSHNYELEDTLNPSRGYWVAASTVCIVTVCNPPKKDSFAKVHAPRALDQPLWMAAINIVSGDGNAIQLNREFGVAAEGTEGFDIGLDLPVPPSPAGGLTLDAYFQGEGQIFNRFQRQIKSPSDSQIWILRVSSESAFTLTWDITNLPSQLDVVIENGSNKIDLRKQEFLNIPGGEYVFHIRTNKTEVVEEVANLASLELFPSYPNPFNLGTVVRYQLPEASYVALRIYNIAGQLVKTLVDGWQDSGFREVTWNGVGDNGEKVSSGIYFCLLKTSTAKRVEKIVLLK